MFDLHYIPWFQRVCHHYWLVSMYYKLHWNQPTNSQYSNTKQTQSQSKSFVYWLIDSLIFGERKIENLWVFCFCVCVLVTEREKKRRSTFPPPASDWPHCKTGWMMETSCRLISSFKSFKSIASDFRERKIFFTIKKIITTIINTKVCILKTIEKEKCLEFFLNRSTRNSPFNDEWVSE